MRYKNILFTIAFSVVLLVGSTPVFADVYSVSFRFDSDSQKLYFNDDGRQVISVDTSKTLSTYAGSQMYPNGKYEAVFISVKGNEIARKKFDAQSGVFSIDFPYYSVAERLDIYKEGLAEKVLSLDLSDYTKCLMNGICEYEKGESLETCISDCASDTVAFSPETQQLLDANNGTIIDSTTGEVLLQSPDAQEPAGSNQTSDTSSSSPSLWVVILAGIFFIGACVAAFFVIRNMRRG